VTHEEQVECTRRWCKRCLAVFAILGHRVTVGSAAVDLTDLQATMARTYGERDAARGIPATMAWLAEEVGELARAARKGDRGEQLHELGDVLAWLASLANQLGLSLDEAVARYADACPKCGQSPCGCT